VAFPCSVVREYRGLRVHNFHSFELFFHTGQGSWDRSQASIARGADGQPWPVMVLKVRERAPQMSPYLVGV
jgi:hypothetical protein